MWYASSVDADQNPMIPLSLKPEPLDAAENRESGGDPIK